MKSNLFTIVAVTNAQLGLHHRRSQTRVVVLVPITQNIPSLFHNKTGQVGEFDNRQHFQMLFVLGLSFVNL